MSSASDVERARQHKDRAAELLIKGKAAAALSELKKALQLAPEDQAARKKMADLLAKEGRGHEAVAEYQHLAGRYAADGQLVQAIAVSKLILQIDPAHRQTQETLASLYSRRQDRTGGTWLERIPSNMAGALNVKHVKKEPEPVAAPETPVEVADEDVEQIPAPVEVEIEVEIDVATLPPSPLFSDLPREIFIDLLEKVVLRTVPDGEPVVREGERGDAMYVISQGRVNVVRSFGKPDMKTVAEMGEGTFFGEIGLVADVPRLASVVANGEVMVLEVTREMMQELQQRHPELEQLVQRFYKERLLANLLRSSPLFSGLAAKDQLEVVDRFDLRSVEEGRLLLVENQPGAGLFVLLRGRCAAFHTDPVGAEERYPDLGEGDVFGEISLLFNRPATATVRAEASCLLLTLDAQTFREKVLSNARAAAHIAALSAERLARTARMLEEESHRWGSLV